VVGDGLPVLVESRVQSGLVGTGRRPGGKLPFALPVGNWRADQLRVRPRRVPRRRNVHDGKMVFSRPAMGRARGLFRLAASSPPLTYLPPFATTAFSRAHIFDRANDNRGGQRPNRGAFYIGAQVLPCDSWAPPPAASGKSTSLFALRRSPRSDCALVTSVPVDPEAIERRYEVA